MGLKQLFFLALVSLGSAAVIQNTYTAKENQTATTVLSNVKWKITRMCATFCNLEGADCVGYNLNTATSECQLVKDAATLNTDYNYIFYEKT